jgi:hypothetical protein
VSFDGKPVPIWTLLDEEDLAIIREDADEGLQVEFEEAEGHDD